MEERSKQQWELDKKLVEYDVENMYGYFFKIEV